MEISHSIFRLKKFFIKIKTAVLINNYNMLLLPGILKSE